ncbi:hypothetical protein H1P_1400013 [Hyella patelloides LEGE 07179]|uniref:Tetratricopeptide repeat protein n=1 Tax=Hyella patelloides LEGE 07179 TaxID=945734 RepID=A0A563VLU9_9CYAN|nr:hypothetical protein [Hyella patelloides]VEP12285.1 hypothetical protein H1P_1400013 [Hyella patelloides LEGE 07179]
MNACNYKKAVKDYRKVINLKLDKNISLNFWNFSQALFNLNKKSKAIAAIENSQ